MPGFYVGVCKGGTLTWKNPSCLRGPNLVTPCPQKMQCWVILHNHVQKGSLARMLPKF